MKPENQNGTADTEGVALSQIVMPSQCGVYMWQDERVSVTVDSHGDLMALAGDNYESVQDLDYDFRAENSEQDQMSPDRPWRKIEECGLDFCFGHNAELSREDEI